MSYLPEWYDNWRLESGFTDFFECPECEERKDIDELGDSEVCLACEFKQKERNEI